MNKQRIARTFAATLALAAGCAFAQDVVKSSKIIEALTAKDIVVDSAPQRTPSPGRPAPARQRAGTIDLQVQFQINSAELLPIGQMQLDELGYALADRLLVADGFEITGHTDRSGDAERNLRLSLERAASVRNYLVTRHGVSPARLMTAGLGSSYLADPMNPNSPVNRRVEIRRIALMPGFAAPAPQRPALPAATGGRLVPTPQ